MLGLYYRIWVDCITNLWQKEESKKNWKFKSMLAMNIAMTFNFAFFMAILQRNVLGYYFYDLELPIESKYMNNVIVFVILYILPCVIFNYLLIFRNRRYEKLLKKYPYHKGNFFVVYFIFSIFLPIIVLWIGIILNRLHLIQ